MVAAPGNADTPRHGTVQVPRRGASGRRVAVMRRPSPEGVDQVVSAWVRSIVSTTERAVKGLRRSRS